MAETDWTVLNDSLAPGTVARGVSAGPTPPPGGGSFLLGFSSLATAEGAVGFFVNGVNFAPMAKGGQIQGCIKRATSGGPLAFAPFFFMCAGGPSVNDNAYMLGLSDDDPHKIVLKKGAMSTGLPADAEFLRESGDSFNPNWWHQLRLDVIVNLNGDVVLKCYYNDLSVNDCDTPVWQSITGMNTVIDDGLSIESGSPGYTSGYAGFGMYSKNVTRRSYFDQIRIGRQTTP